MRLDVTLYCDMCEHGVEDLTSGNAVAYCEGCFHEVSKERMGLLDALEDAYRMVEPLLKTDADRARVAPWLKLLREGGIT